MLKLYYVNWAWLLLFTIFGFKEMLGYTGHVKSEDVIVTFIKWDVKTRIEFCNKVKFSLQNKDLCPNWSTSSKVFKNWRWFAVGFCLKFLCSSSLIFYIAAICTGCAVYERICYSAVLYCLVVCCCSCGAQLHWVVELVFIFL